MVEHKQWHVTCVFRDWRQREASAAELRIVFAAPWQRLCASPSYRCKNSLSCPKPHDCCDICCGKWLFSDIIPAKPWRPCFVIFFHNAFACFVCVLFWQLTVSCFNSYCGLASWLSSNCSALCNISLASSAYVALDKIK